MKMKMKIRDENLLIEYYKVYLPLLSIYLVRLKRLSSRSHSLSIISLEIPLKLPMTWNICRGVNEGQK